MIELRRDRGVERIELEPSTRISSSRTSRTISDEAPLLLGRADAVGQARAIAALFRSAETGATTEPEAGV